MGEGLRKEFAHNQRWTDYVRHSHAISRSCRILAELKGVSESDCQMYTIAGLTHDIGRIVIMIAADVRTAPLLGTTPERMKQIIHDEKEAYGLNHCEVGEFLFRKWNFSEVMQQGILRHHTPLLSDDFDLPGAIIFVSHLISMSDFTGEIIHHMLNEQLLEHLGLGLAELVEAKKLYEASS